MARVDNAMPGKPGLIFFVAVLAALPFLPQKEKLSARLVNGPAGIRFLDIAPQSKLNFKHVSGSAEKAYLPETFSGGVAWIDYNRDGWPDLYLVNGGHWEDLTKGKRTVSNALFRNNRDRTFTDVTSQARVAGSHWGMGSRSEITITTAGPISTYATTVRMRSIATMGDGTFTDVTDSAKVGDPGWSSSAAFGDYDGDGWLDLYVTNYVVFDHKNPPSPDCQYRGIKVQCGPKGQIPAADVLYHNNGDGTFSDVTSAAGVAVPPAYGLGRL